MSSWRTRSLSVSDHPPVYARGKRTESNPLQSQARVPVLKSASEAERRPLPQRGMRQRIARTRIDQLGGRRTVALES
jgi:hypothetical protein